MSISLIPMRTIHDAKWHDAKNREIKWCNACCQLCYCCEHMWLFHIFTYNFFFYFAAIAVDIAYASFSWWALIFSFYIDPFFTAIFFPLALFTLHVFRVCVLNWSHIKTIWSRYLWTCTCYMLMELLLEKCGRNACHRQTFKLMLCICTYN